MTDIAALRVAIDLLRVPSRVRPIRSAALPDGVPLLLEIAAGDARAAARAADLTGRTPEVVRDASAFFVEQILLAPESDSYRVLGCAAKASNADLRRNMALLLKWLHPDMEHSGNGRADRSMFAGRVTLAWDDLKTAERRAAYDAARKSKIADGRKAEKGKRSRFRKASAARQWLRPTGPRHIHPPLRPMVPRRGFWGMLLALLGRRRH
jgi:DnaJ domain